jgi:hypothetical protein
VIDLLTWEEKKIVEFTAGSTLFISLRSYTVEEEAEPLQELNILHIFA